MRHSAFLAVILVSGLLSGCSLFSKGGADFACPKTGFLDHADKVTWLAADGKSVAGTAAIKGFNGDCSVTGKDNDIAAEVTLNLPFEAHKGPAAGDVKSKEIPYFIAILSQDEQVLQRQSFTTTVDFDNTGTGISEEDHVLRIPLKARGDGGKYTVAIGFALTPAQLKYNVERK